MSIKNVLRTMRREGYFTAQIDLLSKGWYAAANLRSRFHKRTVDAALRECRFREDPGSLVDFAMNAGNGFFRPMQNRDEIERLVERVQQLKPKTILEIGTARGGTLFLFCQSAAEDAEIVSLDLPYGKNGGGFPQWKEPVYRLFAKPAQRLTLLRGNSHLEASRSRVVSAVGGKKFDLIMIDGDHSYMGVKRDFELYSPLVSERGIIVLHDILVNRFDPEIDVNRFWEEVAASHECEEIVDSYQQGVFGIGVVMGLGQRQDAAAITALQVRSRDRD
jgi:predicted O-methyltransferase YrrM